MALANLHTLDQNAFERLRLLVISQLVQNQRGQAQFF